MLAHLERQLRLWPCSRRLSQPACRAGIWTDNRFLDGTALEHKGTVKCPQSPKSARLPDAHGCGVRELLRHSAKEPCEHSTRGFNCPAMYIPWTSKCYVMGIPLTILVSQAPSRQKWQHTSHPRLCVIPIPLHSPSDRILSKPASAS
jgi:hypothetical protein